jgi:hypothetical protein
MDETGSTSQVAFIVALLATVGIMAQNGQFALAFGWALIHGAGVSSVLAFLPAAIGLAILWAGYIFLKRKSIRRMALVFTTYALGVLLGTELLLPGTPLKAWIGARSLEAVEVRNVRDEVLLSARGNPIGIRVTFEAVVPRTRGYGISASVMTPANRDLPWPVHLDHSPRHIVEPSPSPVRDDVYDVFEKGVVYTFTQDMMPAFLLYDERERAPCLRNVTTKYVSEADFLLALSKSRDMKYHTEIQAENASDRVVAREYVTTRGYDIEAMYRTIAIEGDRRCGS